MRTYTIVLSGFLLLCGLLLTAAPARAEFFDIHINPQATFFRTSEDQFALEATPIDLGAMGIHPGDRIRLERVGTYQPASYLPDGNTDLVGIFSSSNELLAADQRNRVPGGVSVLAVPTMITQPTFFGNLDTTIPGAIDLSSGVVVQVPDTAKFLFVSPNDSFFGDNVSPKGDYGLQITTGLSHNPEPSTLTLLTLGTLGMLGYAWRCRQRRL
jgi:hypothetical protein